MKKIFLYSIAIFFLSSCTKNITEGLNAYYPFNGNLEDYSENNNHGYSDSVSFSVGKNKKANSALVLSRTEIQFDSKVIDETAFSISFWLYLDSYSSKNQYIITNGGETRASQGFSFLVTGDRYENSGYSKNRILFIVSDQNLNMRSGLISPVIKENKWIHVTGIWNGKGNKGLSLYLNGKLVDCENYSSELTFGSKSHLKIGRPIIISDYFLTGKLDEVRLYDRVLNKKEIKQIKNYR